MSRVVAALLLVAGCTCLQPVTECSEPSCDGGTPPLALDAYCAAFNEHFFCNAGKKSGSVAPDVPCEVVTRNTTAESAQVCLFRERNALDAGLTRYDPVLGRACLTELERGVASASEIDACARMWTGSLAPGQPCQSNVECVPGAWCERTAECQARCARRQPAGGVVTDPYGCEADVAAAFQNDGGWLCRAAVGSGMACRFGDEVISGTSCLAKDERCGSSSDGGAGVCTPTQPERSTLLARGQLCTRGTSFCQRGLACRANQPGGSVGTCDDVIGRGGVCTADWNGCAEGLVCDVATTGTCVVAPALGESCRLAPCGRGLQCLNGVCAREALLGQPCTGACELGTACTAGVCAMPCR